MTIKYRQKKHRTNNNNNTNIDDTFDVTMGSYNGADWELIHIYHQ